MLTIVTSVVVMAVLIVLSVTIVLTLVDFLIRLVWDWISSNLNR